jgi:hypothetical protein
MREIGLVRLEGIQFHSKFLATGQYFFFAREQGQKATAIVEWIQGDKLISSNCINRSEDLLLSASK